MKYTEKQKTLLRTLLEYPKDYHSVDPSDDGRTIKSLVKRGVIKQTTKEYKGQMIDVVYLTGDVSVEDLK